MSKLNLALSFQSKEYRSCSVTSEPTVFTTWGFDDLECDVEIDDVYRKPAWGAVVGCSDGSIYIFCPDMSRRVRRKSTTLPKRRFSACSETLHPYHIPPHLSLTRSRNPSPMSSRTNLAITSSKSRAVSGLSKEQVEAPKNYVDFEDEQERMKGMISDRTVKDVKDRSPRASLAPSPTYRDSHSRRIMDDARSIASVESSSTMLSPPLSPTLGPSNTGSHRKHLVLRTRIMPRDFGPEHSVASLLVLEDGELFVALQECGKVSLFKSIDGSCIVSVEPGAVPTVFKTLVLSQGTGSQVLWKWISLHTIQINDSIIIVAIGKADDHTIALDGSETDDKARVTVYELADVREYEFEETTLAKIGDFVFEGCAEGFTTRHDGCRAIKLYQVNDEAALVVRTLQFLPHAVATSSGSSVRLESQVAPRIDVLLSSELGKFPLTGKVRGLCIKRIEKTTLGVTWSTDELLAFTLYDDRVTMRSVIPLQEALSRVEWIDEHNIQLFFLDRIDTYKLPDAATNESTESVEKPAHTTTTLLSSVPIYARTVVCSTQYRNQHHLGLTLDTNNQQISLLLQHAVNGASKEKRSSIWSSPKPTPTQESSPRRLISVLPIELASIVIGYDDGYLSNLSITELIQRTCDMPHLTTESTGCAILSLFLVRNARTGQRLVVGGGDDGSVIFWDLVTLELKARWVVFTEPLAHVVYLEDETTGRLRGCCLCVSGDGTIAIISVDGLNFLYLIPGSPVPLQAICLGSDNLVLFYADNRTRVWDVKTGELRRSMSSEKATEMLAQGGWFMTDLENGHHGGSKSLLLTLNKSTAHGDPSPVSVFDVGAILDNYPRNGSSKPVEQVTPEHLRALLAILHTPGSDEHADRLLSDFLRLESTNGNVSVGSFDQLSFRSFFLETSLAIWQISPEITAVRLLIIVALLNALSTTEGCEVAANSMLSFYTVSLPSLVGLAYQGPSLAVLAYFWNESAVSDIRSAAKQLFDNEVARLPDDEVGAFAEKWRHKLPCILPEDQRQSSKAALALSICGNIAIERYALLSSTTLSDVAKSVTLYFHDDTSPHRVLAIDLCSRGFDLWQQYFDAMEALRSLFVLATNSRKETINVKNPGPYARMAVLQIASSNSPLFVTTLSLDILHPKSIEYNKSVLQIIAFLIRKKPLVLYPNLPRLMEAVVKSLDPNHNAEREAVLDSVTEIIALVVSTFPSLDFHSDSQRLAVGTNEGAVIMYDLKTATRLYVLEGHGKRLSGISFSPDGRRMVTLSVEERVLLVWKVGSSFTSFFHPGAPPRQGRSGSEPYKTLSFVLQSNEGLTVEESLKFVSFKWHSDRSVRVQIRDAVFTFST